MFPGVDFSQGTKTFGRVTEVAEFRFGSHVQNLDIYETESDNHDDRQDGYQKDMTFTPINETWQHCLLPLFEYLQGLN